MCENEKNAQFPLRRRTMKITNCMAFVAPNKVLLCTQRSCRNSFRINGKLVAETKQKKRSSKHECWIIYHWVYLSISLSIDLHDACRMCGFCKSVENFFALLFERNIRIYRDGTQNTIAEARTSVVPKLNHNPGHYSSDKYVWMFAACVYSVHVIHAHAANVYRPRGKKALIFQAIALLSVSFSVDVVHYRTQYERSFPWQVATTWKVFKLKSLNNTKLTYLYCNVEFSATVGAHNVSLQINTKKKQKEFLVNKKMFRFPMLLLYSCISR